MSVRKVERLISRALEIRAARDGMLIGGGFPGPAGSGTLPPGCHPEDTGHGAVRRQIQRPGRAASERAADGRRASSNVREVWLQRQVRLPPKERGFHLVTREVEQAVPEIARLRVGVAHVFVRHTSASLTLNENASADVRRDFESWFSDAVPEEAGLWTHTVEGPDDMPAHVKASLLGASLTLPVRDGRLELGTWQGIYLGEHRDRGGPRSLLLTLWGE